MSSGPGNLRKGSVRRFANAFLLQTGGGLTEEDVGDRPQLFRCKLFRVVDKDFRRASNHPLRELHAFPRRQVYDLYIF